MDEDKTLKAITFSGKREDYMKWSAKFLSYAQVKGLKKIFTGAEKYTALTDDKEKLKFIKDNDIAYSLLHMAVKDDVSFSAVYSGSSKLFPDGDAHIAWKNLKTIFKPVSNARQHELEEEFHGSKLLKDQTNPDEWFAQLEKIRLQLKLDHNEEITDKKMINHILYNTKPGIYRTTVTVLQREFNKGLNLTLNDVKEDYRQIYARNPKLENTNAKSGENLLFGKAKKFFKGDCRNCGKKGHKATDCWEKEQNKDKRPAGYKAKNTSDSANVTNSGKLHCNYCKKDNHTEDRCYKKQNDQKKKDSTDKATPSGAAIPLLLAIGKAESENLMKHAIGNYKYDKHTFIADSGATAHMMMTSVGLTDMVDWRVPITVGNSEQMWT
jgi:hypothetical protein